IAVHSTKDMPTEMPPGLAIGAVLPRAEPWDALVLPRRASADDTSTANVPLPTTLDDVLRVLGATPVLGTSSVRRVTQLHRLMPGATFEPIRGNLDPRLRKLDEGGYDAIVLACAGLVRLGAADRISARLPLTVAVPPPGQGAVAVQLAENAPETLHALLGAID